MGVLVEMQPRGQLLPSFLTCAAGEARRREGERTENKALVIGEGKPVCVTTGLSFLGLAIVSRLAQRGYSVRAIVHSEEDERYMKKEIEGDCRVEIVKSNMNELHTLAEAFGGCCAVIHTSAFTDPAGLSGYTRTMVDIEVKASKNVIKACAMSPSVRACVFTSSLLACVWSEASESSDRSSAPSRIDHCSWSDERFCFEKKLWYALGKLRAEKAAWKVAGKRGVRLATICSGLVTGAGFGERNSTATIAYLKGLGEMYEQGLLATVDVHRLADAHVCLLEGMRKTASGRFICFDRVIGNEYELDQLTCACGIAKCPLTSAPTVRYELSNAKMENLTSHIGHCRWEL